ncbi:4Fe-4S binding protein [Maledivibacter halophilus]|uniref:Pyruvate ferredoxin oxidoreductase, delta subunit n=1 Tax=Maledivibacter halophilus TaxID=36842 RepID=A0A1T5I9Z2_9FIRM|nr:4Fe-4S binding protein [Maledivibacter halophilus]SKC36024.1 pyruvate ferredoxin oxidoreductase, delta subunit [Maledivibacter halophilus]
MKFKSKYIAPIGADGIHVLNTGDWRTQRPVIDHEKCIKCGICFLYCPVNSINKIEGEFVISYDYCKGCGICAHECPKKAINMAVEEGK